MLIINILNPSVLKGYDSNDTKFKTSIQVLLETEGSEFQYLKYFSLQLI